LKKRKARLTSARKKDSKQKKRKLKELSTHKNNKIMSKKVLD
jgi:hypothetical protein